MRRYETGCEEFPDAKQFLDAIVLAGPEKRCREWLEEHRGSLLRLPIIAPFQVGNESRVEVMKRTVRAYAN